MMGYVGKENKDMDFTTSFMSHSIIKHRLRLEGRNYMETNINILMEMLSLKDDTARYSAFQELLTITDSPVPWFDQYRSLLMEKLSDENSYQRSIGLMLLCNLAKNDTHHEYRQILDLLMPLINDEKFITERQYLQSIWKVAIVNEEYSKRIVPQLEKEFYDCLSKKHSNLLRQDIIESMIKILEKMPTQEIKDTIGKMIEDEQDEKSKKKYIKMLEAVM